MEHITKSASETQELGKRVAADLMSKDQATVLALQGDLGAGKTTFVQGLAEGLQVNQRILSPTFILMRHYSLDNNSKYEDFYHIDLYRLEEDIENELENLGVIEIFQKPKNIVAIEWAEKAGEVIPDDVLWIKFENINEEKRKIVISD